MTDRLVLAGNDIAALPRLLGPRYLVRAALAAGVAALVIGVPTDVIPNPWFTRMTPVRTLDVLLLPPTALLLGALFALPVRGGPSEGRTGVAGFGSGMLGWFAIGCPICNKIVLAVAGVSGALTYFAPVQPILGISALVLAVVALAVRARLVVGGCPVRPAAPRPIA